MSLCFITATGTDIGKTFVTCALIRALRRRGQAVAALKPVVSGFDDTTTANSDPARLLEALGEAENDASIARIAPWRFRAPLSPDMAAAREGRSIDFAALLAFCRAAVAPERVTLVEGVGGLMVPLDGSHTVLDWIVELRWPTILVAGSYLGTISHSLTALDVLARRKVPVAALVVSETPGSTVPLDETVATIAHFAAGIPMLALPRLAHAAAPHPAIDRLAESMLAALVPHSHDP
jgi:dethiobiotin synthetase